LSNEHLAMNYGRTLPEWPENNVPCYVLNAFHNLMLL